jgi:transcriptional regulator with XRE-family HTH domain
MSDVPTVAAFIRRVRTQAGLNQADFAAVVGVNQTAVSHWERGTTEPFGGHLFLILVRLAPTSITVLTDCIDQHHPAQPVTPPPGRSPETVAPAQRPGIPGSG